MKIKMKVSKFTPVSFMVLSVIAMMAISTNAHAQKGFNLSVKATPQFSYLINKDDKNNALYSRKATFNTNFGIGAGYDFTKNIGVAIDGLYSIQGQKYTLGGKEYYQKVNYIKVPVYFTYNTGPARLISFSGKVGPQVSFLSTSKLTYNNGKDSLNNTNAYFEDATFGGAAEAGMQFRIDRNLFLVAGVRFDVDFSDAMHNDYALYPGGKAKTYNMTGGLEVGLKYNFW